MRYCEYLEKCTGPRLQTTTIMNVMEECFEVKFEEIGFGPPLCVNHAITGTFFIENKSEDAVIATVQDSFDGKDWVDEESILIPEDTTQILVPLNISNFWRLMITSELEEKVKVKVKFLAQLYN